MFCRTGFELNSPIISHDRNIYSHRCAPKQQTRTSNTFDALVRILSASFNIFSFSFNSFMTCHYYRNHVYYTAALLRMGLISAGSEGTNYNFRQLLYIIHKEKESSQDSAAFRVCRQLLALGVFRRPVDADPIVLWTKCCLYGTHRLIQCDFCSEGKELSTTEECPIVARLGSEFFSGPLTLQQLSRIEIRRCIGVRHFERRINTLPLPPLLLEYVSRANEMLTEEAAAPTETKLAKC